MKKGARVVGVMLACMMMFALAACSNKNDTGTTAPESSDGRVTEAQWEAACDLQAIGNFTVEVTDKYGKLYRKMKWDGNKAYIQSFKEGIEVYYESNNGVVYGYLYDSEKKVWTKQLCLKNGEPYDWNPYDIIRTPDMRGQYNTFYYKESEKAYTPIKSNRDEIYVLFSDGKLREMQEVFSEGTAVAKFTDYGATEVTLPQDSIPQ